MSNQKPATVADAIRIMRSSDSEGTIRDGHGNPISGIGAALRAAGVTATQAARAARRLGWASDDASDWSDSLEA